MAPYKAKAGVLRACIQTSTLAAPQCKKVTAFYKCRRGQVLTESLKWLLRVRRLEQNQAQQTVDRLVVGWFESSSLLGWKWISERHNGSLRRVCDVV